LSSPDGFFDQLTLKKQAHIIASPLSPDNTFHPGIRTKSRCKEHHPSCFESLNAETDRDEIRVRVGSFIIHH